MSRRLGSRAEGVKRDERHPFMAMRRVGAQKSPTSTVGTMFRAISPSPRLAYRSTNSWQPGQVHAALPSVGNAAAGSQLPDRRQRQFHVYRHRYRFPRVAGNPMHVPLVGEVSEQLGAPGSLAPAWKVASEQTGLPDAP